MPSLVNKTIVKEIKKTLDQAKSFALAEYDKISVKSLEELRRNLEVRGGSCQVMKNRLLKIVLKEKGIELPEHCFDQTTLAVISTKDISDYAKLLVDFSKKNNTLKIKAGVTGQQTISGEEVIAIAKLPSREVLLGMVLSALLGPVRGLANVSNALLRNFVYAIKAIEDKKTRTMNSPEKKEE